MPTEHSDLDDILGTVSEAAEVVEESSEEEQDVSSEETSSDQASAEVSTDDEGGEEEGQETEPQPMSEVQALKQQIQQLSAALAETQAKMSKGSGQANPGQELADIQFLSENESLDEVFSSAEAFNALLNKVYKQGVTTGRENYLREVPEVVAPVIDERARKQAVVTDFFMRNEDLIQNKDFVGVIAVELAQKNSDLSYNDLFIGKGGKPSILETEVRKRLGLSGKKQKREKVDAPINTPQTSSRQPSKAELTQQEKDLRDLLG